MCTSFPVDMTATTGNLCTLTSVTPTVASRPISDGPMCVPLASTHSPLLMSCPIGLQTQRQNLTSDGTLTFTTVPRSLRRRLPDVLARTGLHHDPHLQLLCALQTIATVSGAARRCQHQHGRSFTHVLRLPEQLRVFHLDHSVGSAGDGSAGRHSHHLTRHHRVGGLQHTHTRTHAALSRACLVRSLNKLRHLNFPTCTVKRCS